MAQAVNETGSGPPETSPVTILQCKLSRECAFVATCRSILDVVP